MEHKGTRAQSIKCSKRENTNIALSAGQPTYGQKQKNDRDTVNFSSSATVYGTTRSCTTTAPPLYTLAVALVTHQYAVSALYTPDNITNLPSLVIGGAVLYVS